MYTACSCLTDLLETNVTIYPLSVKKEKGKRTIELLAEESEEEDIELLMKKMKETEFQVTNIDFIKINKIIG
jgi:hypothetical protein